MKIILLEDIKSLGKRGDIKNVTDGYAGNFLLPQKKAVVASSNNVIRYQTQQAKSEQKVSQQIINHQKIKKVLDKQVLIFEVKVSEKGHLFQAIHELDIIKAIKAKFNLDLDKKWFKTTVALKEIGKHHLVLQLSCDLGISILIDIRPQD